MFRKKRDCTIGVAKTKALISFTVTAKLICVFVFVYVKSRFSHDEAHFMFCKQPDVDDIVLASSRESVSLSLGFPTRS